jgi:hypothetical protein
MAYSYGTALNKSYVSSTAFLDQREILNKLLNITNEESSFLDVMEMTGRSVVSSVPQYHHFVNSELYLLGVAQASAAAASSVNITLDATSYAYANQGDLVLMQDGKVSYLYSKNGSNAVTLKSVDSTNLTTAANDKLAFFSNANGEGSLSPDSRRWGVTKYVNQVQNFKAKFTITDIQKTSKVEVDFNGQPFYMLKGQHESLIKFRGDISAGLMFGRLSASGAVTSSSTPISGFADGSSSNILDAEGNPVSTTMGLDQYASLYGYALTQGTNGTVLLSEMSTLTQALNKIRAPQEYFLFVGTVQNIGFDNTLNNLGNSGITAGVGISGAGRFMISGKNLDLGIDSVKLYGRTYHKKLLPLLDHQYISSYGATHKFDKSAYGVPAGDIKTLDGQTTPRMQVRYLAQGDTDLRYREVLLGGLAPTPTNERSVLEVHYQSVQGLQVLGANQLFKIQ